MDKYEFLMSFKVWEQDIYFDYQHLLSMQLTCEKQKIDIFLKCITYSVATNRDSHSSILQKCIM